MTFMNILPKPLDSGYTAEVNSLTKQEWEDIITQFSDGNIYQTWSYNETRVGKKNISHLLLKYKGDIVAAAQARLVRFSPLKLGVAYIRWAPLWQLKNQENNPLILSLVLRALRNEFVCRQGLILRIFPFLYKKESEDHFHSFIKEGFTYLPHKESGRTLVLDLSPQIELLRKQLDQKWRNCLNRAERNQLELKEGSDDSLFAEFIKIYDDLIERKKFNRPSDINEFRLIQNKLAPELKMRIILCKSNNIYTSGAIFSAVGDTCVYLFGATNDHGMSDKSSYLIQWNAIQWMKNIGCRYYNLNGINPTKNPGTYRFKAGILGKQCRDIHYLGFFDCYSGILVATLVRIAEKIIPMIKNIISILKN